MIIWNDLPSKQNPQTNWNSYKICKRLLKWIPAYTSLSFHLITYKKKIKNPFAASINLSCSVVKFLFNTQWWCAFQKSSTLFPYPFLIRLLLSLCKIDWLDLSYKIFLPTKPLYIVYKNLYLLNLFWFTFELLILIWTRFHLLFIRFFLEIELAFLLNKCYFYC